MSELEKKVLSDEELENVNGGGADIKNEVRGPIDIEIDHNGAEVLEVDVNKISEFPSITID